METDDVEAAIVDASAIIRHMQCLQEANKKWDREVLRRSSTYVLLMLAGRDADAELLIRHRAADLIESGQPMPSELGIYIARRLRDGCAVKKRGRGRQRQVNTSRDVRISLAVRHVMKRGFLATRNEGTKDAQGPESACSIVTTALGRLGINIGEHAVAKIWGTTHQHFKRLGIPDLDEFLPEGPDATG